MSVLSDGGNTPGLTTLESLLAGEKKLARAARSQLRALVDELGRGRTLAELAFESLAPTSRQALENAGVKAVWEPLEQDRSIQATSILDLVEVWEIQWLGSGRKRRVETAPIEQGAARDDDLAVHDDAEEIDHAGA